MLISFAVTAKLICTFVFAQAKIWFSQDLAHFVCFFRIYSLTIPVNNLLVMLRQSYNILCITQRAHDVIMTSYQRRCDVIMTSCACWVNSTMARQCVLLKKTQCPHQQGSNPQPLSLDSNALPISHCAPHTIIEPPHGKTNNLQMRKQRRGKVTAKLISIFVFATGIVQFLYLNPKFQASSFFSVLVQAGLCQTCSETTLLVFPRGGSIVRLCESLFPWFLIISKLNIRL